jgi:tetratricopeptide (TPR) repeat protein
VSTPVSSAEPEGTATLLERAVTLHRAEDAANAEGLYRAVLAREPDQFDATHMLGVLLHARGQPGEALLLLRRAVTQRPNFAPARLNLGVVLFDLRAFDKAEPQFAAATRLDPSYAQAHFGRGNALRALGRHAEAAESYRSALALSPDHAEALNNLGTTLALLNQADAAVTALHRAVGLRPDFADAWLNFGQVLLASGHEDDAATALRHAITLRPGLALAHLRLALALRRLGRLEAAAESARQATALAPGESEAWTELGVVLHALDETAEALAAFRRALALNPRDAKTHSNLGTMLMGQDRIEEARLAYAEAVTRDPGFADAWNNLGGALHGLGRLEEALAAYRRAVALRPDFADAHFNLALVLLAQGRFTEGWPEYEHRWGMASFATVGPPDVAPLWQGEDIAGKTILVQAEQGFGDVFQFARYLPKLRAAGAELLLGFPPGLLRILRPLGGRMVGSGERIDFRVPLLSLPGRFGTVLETIPAEIPYLETEAGLVARWQERIGRGRFRIGISWQGRPGIAADRGRSIPLRYFAPFARLPGVRLISLQKGHGTEQIAALPVGTVETLWDRFTEEPDDFVDTAAVMAGLDLVITSDTAVAHLAGALGVRTWVALKHAPDWRWLEGRTDCPWYPTMRLFRQREPDAWENVFSEMEAALAGEVGL